VFSDLNQQKNKVLGIDLSLHQRILLFELISLPKTYLKPPFHVNGGFLFCLTQNQIWRNKMSDTNLQQNPLFTSEVVYQLPYSGEICSDIPYGEENDRLMDIYYPENRTQLMPAILIVTGYRDSGVEELIGKKFKELMWHVSWAKLIAASGVIAITYSNIKPDEDLFKLHKYLQDNGTPFGIDTKRLGLMACSGNVPNAIAMLMSKNPIRCAVLCYGYMMDFGDSTEVADAKDLYGFVTPDNKSNHFPDKAPILLARAGKDENIGLNSSLDQFVQEALIRNAPIELINYPEGQHCFDILNDSKESVGVIKRILEFLRCYLLE
jgi:dienelactone hydrolase